MALDRFIRWKGKRPAQKQVIRALKNFVGEAAQIEKFEGRFYCTFLGRCSHPFEDEDGELTNYGHKIFKEETPRERWIEVFFHRKSIDVITRNMDPFTDTLANEFARQVAHFWEGELEE